MGLEENEVENLLLELVPYALPIRTELRMRKTPLDQMHIHLSERRFPEQHKCGLHKIIGMDIIWY